MNNISDTYIGNKGYTIPKKYLTVEQQKQIRNDLMIKPRVHGIGLMSNQTSFPAYRESNNKMYVPHYYGVEKFGKPSKTNITKGEDIKVVFNGTLRENQTTVVDTFMKHVSTCDVGGGLLELPCAYGKCLGIDTEILMYDGTIKKVQDVIEGDLLMGDDSTPRKVLSLARGKEQMYKVEDPRGEGYIVNESHILSLKCLANYNNTLQKDTVVDISVKDYLHLPNSFDGNTKANVLKGYRVPIHFPETPLPFNPYMMGYWLGCGYSRTKIYIQDSIVLHYFTDNLKKYNLSLFPLSKSKSKSKSKYDYTIGVNDTNDTTNNTNNTNNTNDNVFFNLLKELDLTNDKHIPLIYKRNSRENRLQLLAGLMDSIGYIQPNGHLQFTRIKERLIDDIIYLARSLGFLCYKKIKKTSWKYRGEQQYGISYRATIDGRGIENENNDLLQYRIRLRKLEVDDYYGFEIDGNRRFVLGDFTVTHNTVLSLNIISQLKKKTFIIVHKEFLMNQWIERIEQFLPGARVGKIQGQIIDIDDKDIVIGMLQSLSMKEYPSAIFDSFGLTIIDEVHHISSEVFSNTLFKIVTKYMLGLSATMERKDGTTKVFKMFLGDVIFKGKRDEERNVIVRAIEYHVKDDEFNEVKTDFRGNTAYSTMISKLCEYNRRSEFILKVIIDMLEENPSQQIMILAHNKNVLKYLHDAITHRNIATVGYYIGGMKEKALKETEDKKIVIATYAMAAEALDIKTLTTLIMATPKTDIEQSVGRILRDKHSNPIVVDIIDSHDIFKNQWRKRKTFYKKENYKIIYTTNTNYVTDTSKWDIINTPKLNSTAMKCNKNYVKNKKNITINSNSSSDKSITHDSDEEKDNDDDENSVDIGSVSKDKFLIGKCLLKIH
jgi:superfamily II DNA or RNA helicase